MSAELITHHLDAAAAPAETESPGIDMKWYVLHTNSGREKRVQRTLREYIARSDYKDYFDKIIVPTEEVIEMRSGQKRTTERNFYPGYVFIQMDMRKETWHLVKSIPQVSRFVGERQVIGEKKDDKWNPPPPISEHEAQEILDRIQDGVDKPKPKFLFSPGELVRVNEGPFEDFNGVVEDVNYEKSKLRVSVSIFGRSTPMELDFSQVDKS